MKNKIMSFLEICAKDGAITGWICLIISLGLLVGSFFCPPMGIIDGSVLAAVGEIFAFATLFKLPNIIESIKDGKSITISHGDTSLSIEDKGENE